MINNNIIIGAGISGLSFGYFTKQPYILFEQSSQVGGLCKSIKEDGFIFDYSGHFIHIKDPAIKNLLEKLTTKKLLTVHRNASIYTKNSFIPFPFQANLYYLPKKERQECIDGIKKRKNLKIYNNMPFINWSKAMFGDGITKYFMQPYNEKLWNYSLSKLTASWTAPFVPKPDAQSILKYAYEKNKTDYGYNSVFYYPDKNGCGQIINGFYKQLKNNIIKNAKAQEIDYKNKTVFVNGKYFQYNNLISTQPLTELMRQLKNAPANIIKSVKQLHHTSVRCINIGIKYKKEIPKNIKNKHWIYIPEKKYPFYRVGIYSNVSSKLAPKNCYCLYIEFSSKENTFLNCKNTIKHLRNLGIIGIDDEIITANIINMPYAYVIFDKNRQKILNTVTKFLNSHNIYSIGRYGAWEYSFIEKNITDAKKLADKLNLQ
jgi:protoporphyrinogen oxidase